MPAGAVLIFKTGPFAWNGLIAFYIPFVAFFGWLMVMSVFGTRTSRGREIAVTRAKITSD